MWPVCLSVCPSPSGVFFFFRGRPSLFGVSVLLPADYFVGVLMRGRKGELRRRRVLEEPCWCRADMAACPLHTLVIGTGSKYLVQYAVNPFRNALPYVGTNHSNYK